MNEAIGWTLIVSVLLLGPVLLFIGLQQAFSRRPVEEKYRGRGGGVGGAFDAVWSPSAHEAGSERDRQRRASVPAPSPDKGPGRIVDEHRIVIEIDDRE
ncbi:hypothetical protein GCM10025768_24000 [Microbacterium pseudoresistens]|uniref:Uncharacterized protein n=1 Tax=Microbacterium pseudoresistens TaxID=640634 RepID=A0A7Y9EX54_9MICO|nr:hypothetical protein [Microbacterium pseudoresistens]NYD55391.1 hypothetical protein [Microbacterium pseudoresistens]